MDTFRVYAYNPSTDKISVTQVDRNSIDDAVNMVMGSHMPYFKLIKVERLNEYKNWEAVLQVAVTPIDGRMETGPLKINDDHCGYFIRGDNAIGLAIGADGVEEWFKKLPEEYKKGIWIEMSSMLSTIKEMSVCRNK